MTVEFDPVRLDRRRRRIEPAVVVVVVMALGIGAAVAKPWESGPPVQPSAPAVADGTSAPTPAKATPRPTPTLPNWHDVAQAALTHDAWGVSAIVLVRRSSNGLPVSPPTARYLERWTPTGKDAAGTDVAYVNRDDRAIAALGVTVPANVDARSVRVWREHAGDELEWVDATRIDDEGTIGTPLLARQPLGEGATIAAWDAGRYRIDVLTADGIHRIAVLIPNRFGNVPDPDVYAVTAPDIVGATSSDPSAVRIGLFATVDGAAVSIPARESEPLGEVAAWRDRAGSDGSKVAAIYLPRATGLGVMLTAHAAVEAAAIRRLAPDPLPDPPDAAGGISDAQGRTPFVVFPAPDGEVWTPGVYAVSVDWNDAAGRHHGTWHVELRPGVS